MGYDKQKLLRFKETILKNVDFKIVEIKKKIAQREQTELKKFKDQKLNETFISMQSKIKNIKSKFHQKISKKIIDTKNDILTFRSSLFTKLKEACEQQLNNFTQTINYENYLIESIKNSCKNLNLNKTSILKLKRNDLKFKNKILAIANFNSIEADDSIEIGGFKIILTEQKILIDKTLNKLLNDELKNFKNGCELKINFSNNISKEG